VNSNPSIYEVVARADAGYLRVAAHGAFALSRTLRLIDYVQAESDRLGYRKILIDVTALSGGPSITDQFEIASTTAERLRQKKIAVLSNTEAIVKEGFGDNVAFNRGGRARTFINEQAALAWLLEG
jgi:hypothetical protein